MTGWLVRFELFPERFTHSLAGYRGLLSGGPLLVDTWMKIEYNGMHVGYSHSNVDTVGNDSVVQYKVRNKTVLHLNVMGSTQRIVVDNTAHLDAMYRLQEIRFVMTSPQYSMQITAARRTGRQFEVEMKSGSGTQIFHVEIPDNAIVYSPMLEMSLKELRPGEEMGIRLYEPISMSPQSVVVRALRHETITHRGELVQTTVLESQLKGMTSLSWMDQHGKTLRQETAMGWNMIEASPEEALRFGREAGESTDVLRAMAVPVDRVIANPGNLKELEIRLVNASVDGEKLTSGRQAVLEDEKGGIALRLFPGPEFGQAVTEQLDDPSRYLQSTPFVQSDHADIRSKALEITRGAEGAHGKMLALHHWVHKTVKKNPTLSLPSALDVLKTREGDCNEHTYLMTALARSIGIPAKIQVGLVYNQGAFYYHAWPALYDGQGWYEMDPTFGQARVDASHLVLLEGEIGDQLALLSLVGRMEVEIMMEKYESHLQQGGNHD